MSKARKIIDVGATGFAVAFVGMIYCVYLEAALFRRDEVDWGLVLPPFIFINAFMAVRWVIEYRVANDCRKKYMKKRKASIRRIESNAVTRERLLNEGHGWRYDDDGNLYALREAKKRGY